MDNYPFKDETYKIIGICMEVQKTLGYGFMEIIYKDAMELEFSDDHMLYQREDELSINYKGRILKHKFFADFVLFEKIIVEVKSCDKGITEDHIAQTLNYLKASGHNIALIINFGKRRLEYKRFIVD